MTERLRLTREEAIAALNRHGIAGSVVYLIDIIPLIEMIWADGIVQDCEVDVLDQYLVHHVDHINKLAGFDTLSIQDARHFVKRFLDKRPSPELLKTLRMMIDPIRFSCAGEKYKKALKESLLSACIDIATSSITVSPSGFRTSFELSEKRCFFEILDFFEACTSR